MATLIPATIACICATFYVRRSRRWPFGSTFLAVTTICALVTGAESILLLHMSPEATLDNRYMFGELGEKPYFLWLVYATALGLLWGGFATFLSLLIELAVSATDHKLPKR